MVRLTRAQQQARTRSSVLEAAAKEFTVYGYADAKVDRIAERAELTRGAVYSNFPSKRSLYLAVLLDSVPDSHGDVLPPAGVAAAAEAFARVWLERLPLSGDTAADGGLRSRSVAGVFDDEPGRIVLGQLVRLEAVLLALGLESCASRPGERRVRLAELILTLLHGTGDLARSAPGFGDPFDVAAACRHLAGIALPDTWDPPYLTFVGQPDLSRHAWTAPPDLTDVLTGRPAGFDDDGLIVLLGPGRLAAAEEAVRSARPGDRVTIAVMPHDPAETGALVRLRITDLAACLRRVFPADPPVRLVLDDGATLAAAAGTDPARDTETAVRLRGGEIVARAHGRGAAYAVAEEE
ncbi:MAG: helix-turn-helix domain-containing protein [Actinoplanes sp.]